MITIQNTVCFRTPSGYKHGRKDTVRDVISYETDELGNDIHLDRDIDIRILELPARNSCWFCFQRESAEEYYEGDVEEYVIEYAFIVGVDGDGGYLLVSPDKSLQN